MSKREQFLGDHQISYKGCYLIPMRYTDGNLQGYGFVIVYLGLRVDAYCSFQGEWLGSIDGAIAVGKAQIDLDCLKFEHCLVECLK